MTRTDVMASSRPRNLGAAPSGTGSSTVVRGLRALPIALLLALAVLLPSTAVAAEPGTSGYGYGQEPNKPSTSTTPATTTPATTPATTTSPKTGTLPSKESEKPTTPTSETEPEKTSTTPTKASTLPFTGFDLRWDIGFGVVLLGAGFSILAMQRRQRRHGSH
jgi:hypothetical protein